jgi:hypothetical protein
VTIYQTKTFARWAKKSGLQDVELYIAAQEVAAGQVEAALKSAAKIWLSMTTAEINTALRAGEIKEVKQDE